MEPLAISLASKSNGSASEPGTAWLTGAVAQRAPVIHGDLWLTRKFQMVLNI